MGTGMGAVVGALIIATLGTLTLYLSGNRRLRFERLYERRAEVIAELSKSLYQTQRGFISLTNIAPPTLEQRKQQVQDAEEAFNHLVMYYHSNKVWLDRETGKEVESLLEVMSAKMQVYVNNVDGDWVPKNKEAHQVGTWMREEIPGFRRDLEDRFRMIVYPPPWYDNVLSLLAQLQPQNQESSASTQGENNPREKQPM